MSKIRLAISLILLFIMVCLLSRYPVTGQAHAEYEWSEPAADAVIPAAPAEVQVWFTQELFRRKGANTLAVFGPDGTQVDNGDVWIDDDDRKHLLVSLPTGLPDGLYTVQWHNLSVEDGHEASGEFSFTIASEASPGEASPPAPPVVETTAPVPSPASSPAPTPPSGRNLPCLGGLILGTLLVGLVRQQRGSPR